MRNRFLFLFVFSTTLFAYASCVRNVDEDFAVIMMGGM